MKTWFLAVALLSPLLTLAQEAPPPAAAPGANPVYPAVPVQPAPPPAVAPRGHQRDTWYIGFGLGTGNGSASDQDGTFTFKELNGDRSTTNVFLNFKVGATLSPRLLLGLDIAALRSAADQDGISSSIQVTNYDLMATFFPMEEGLYLRGGVGLSALTVEADVAGLGSRSSTYRGGNATIGAGYAFWLGQKFNLTVGLDLSAQSYGSGANKPEKSKMWALWVGADWY